MIIWCDKSDSCHSCRYHHDVVFMDIFMDFQCLSMPFNAFQYGCDPFIMKNPPSAGIVAGQDRRRNSLANKMVRDGKSMAFYGHLWENPDGNLKDLWNLLIGGLEVWNMFYFPFHIWDVILPVDKKQFQDGYCTTNQITVFPCFMVGQTPMTIPNLPPTLKSMFPIKTELPSGKLT